MLFHRTRACLVKATGRKYSFLYCPYYFIKSSCYLTSTVGTGERNGFSSQPDGEQHLTWKHSPSFPSRSKEAIRWVVKKTCSGDYQSIIMKKGVSAVKTAGMFLRGAGFVDECVTLDLSWARAWKPPLKSDECSNDSPDAVVCEKRQWNKRR